MRPLARKNGFMSKQPESAPLPGEQALFPHGTAGAAEDGCAGCGPIGLLVRRGAVLIFLPGIKNVSTPVQP